MTPILKTTDPALGILIGMIDVTLRRPDKLVDYLRSSDLLAANSAASRIESEQQEVGGSASAAGEAQTHKMAKGQMVFLASMMQVGSTRGIFLSGTGIYRGMSVDGGYTLEIKPGDVFGSYRPLAEVTDGAVGFVPWPI